jgi:hypothetical protein
MGGIYKLKKCPNCGIDHRKRGLFCGQSCANASRVITDETKKKMSRSALEYNDTPEGIANARMASQRMSAQLLGAPPPVTVDEFCVDLPDFPPDLPEGYDHASDW